MATELSSLFLIYSVVVTVALELLAVAFCCCFDGSIAPVSLLERGAHGLVRIEVNHDSQKLGEVFDEEGSVVLVIGLNHALGGFLDLE